MPISKESTKISELYIICILGVIGLIALIVEATGGSWIDTLSAFSRGSFLNAGSWGETLTFMVPLALVALGAIISFRAGLVNIGQEGQLVIGGVTATYVGLHLSLPAPITLLLMLGAGFLAGAIWAAIAGVLKFWRGVPEVLTTLLLVTVAFQVSSYGLKNKNFIGNPDSFIGSRSLRSGEIAGDERLGEIIIFGNSISLGIFIMLGLAGAIWFLMNKMTIGFKLQILGQNEIIASRAGVSKKVYGYSVLSFSGGMAGLAGAVILMSGITDYEFLSGFSLNIGWTGLLVALIARNKSWLVVLAATLFAGLHTGSQFLASTGVDRQIGNLTSALFVLALLIPPAVIHHQKRKISKMSKYPNLFTGLKILFNRKSV